MALIDRTTLLAAVRQSITVVEPGEVLAVRVSENASPAEFEEMSEYARRIREEYGVRVLFIAAEEFARLKAADAP